MSSFRLNAGRLAPSPVRGEPVSSVPSHVRNRETQAVGTLVCGHKFYEPYIKHGRLIWCDDCEHNREIKPNPKPTGGVVPDDQGVIPF